ncbi:MAG: hypothetical protein K2Y10_11520 [Burkholderiaceae bacterium]|nr:hypothetical protein [Burkholderiaceae bacterium]
MSTIIHQTKRANPAKTMESFVLKPAKRREDVASSFRLRCAAALRAALPDELKIHGATLSAIDIAAIAESLACQLVKLADESSSSRVMKADGKAKAEWISTQQAADRCGFSRPFVAALLDSGTYQGKVHRTPGGHRKVLANEFEALVAQASAQAPKTLAQARKSVDLTLQNSSANAVSMTQRKQSRARAQALAKKLGVVV